MAGSPPAPSHRCHVRSISLPSRSHPVSLRVEEELQKVRNYIDTESATPKMLQVALRELAGVYQYTEQLLCLPSIQARFTTSSEKRWLEMELDGSVRSLDLCCILKDNLIMKKEHIKDLQLAFRRREGTATQSKAVAFIRIAKKADKDIKNSLRSLKQADKSNATPSDLETIANFLMEVRTVTVSLLQLVSSFLSTQAGRQRSSRWSVITKALSKKKLACEGESDESGLEGLGFFSHFESILHKELNEEKAQKVQSQLQSIEILMEGLENGLESLFRQMIQSRVTLLNILSS